IDEDIGFSGVGFDQRSATRLSCRALQGTDRGRAHRNHPPAPLPTGADLLTHGGSHDDSLTVHAVLEHILYPDRLKGARSHMQGHVRRIDPQRTYALQQRLVEMQPGGGSSNSAWMPVEHGLITLAVGQLILALDVRWQGDVPVDFQLPGQVW